MRRLSPEEVRVRDAAFEKVWQYLLAHPYLACKVVAKGAGMCPGTFMRWTNMKHPGELFAVRVKYGLRMTAEKGASEANHFLFRVYSEKLAFRDGAFMWTGELRMWERYVMADTVEEAMEKLKVRLWGKGIKYKQILLVNQNEGKE